jgi:hypothetical protein
MKARFTDEQIIAMVADTSLSGQRVKDWRRVATRCDRSRTVFLSANTLAANVIFWL